MKKSRPRRTGQKTHFFGEIFITADKLIYRQIFARKMPIVVCELNPSKCLFARLLLLL
ncbi:hypothetical protein [Microseira sp. BLCC-F43]|uniref:hypothetical protein n=1 Tax=Microseira sp. BLCC-F43 TaxID=3153602 RepID=UPI0035B7DFF9